MLEIRERDLDLKSYPTIEGNKVCVSTVALTIEHYGGMWYETMIFGYDGNGIDYGDLFCKRYATKEEAEVGHDRVVSFVSAKDRIPTYEEMDY